MAWANICVAYQYRGGQVPDKMTENSKIFEIPVILKKKK